MLFNFNLRPLDQVSLWGGPGKRSLHWFGLTDGEYWIDAGAERLFEHAEGFSRKHEGHRHLDYFVVRLHEDLLEILPKALEPVPPDLVQYISGERGRSWNARLSEWSDSAIDVLGDDLYWKIYEGASGWIWERDLNLSYLSHCPELRIWSAPELVHIEWNGWGVLVDGEAVWSASTGSFDLPRARFEAEVRDFDARLMQQMAQRVELMQHGPINRDLEIDLVGLEREQGERSHKLDAAFAAVSDTRNWQAVREAIAQTECS